MSKTIAEILAPKPEARPRIYAYAIHDDAHKGLLKVGQTTRDVKQRIAEQLKTAAIENYTIELDESAERADGTIFTDHEVRAALRRKKFENPQLEWMRCSVPDVKTVLAELRTGKAYTGTHHETFPMRREQADAVHKTFEQFQSIWRENPHAVPRFLWNAKMRFGKTFTAYQLAKKLGAKRVLVVTFKPAVEDAWQTDLESHVDFNDWQYLSRHSGSDPTQVSDSKPLVYFGSFQDLLGRDPAGNIKAKNEWLHAVKWDLVVFDEYHFGAWRETAKELFEGEDEAVAKKETKLEYGSGLEEVNEDIGELSEKEAEFLPITTRAYLYLSGTPFRALSTGEFIEEQIFNWTYTDEQRAKEAFAAEHPGQRNPYGALPQMRLLTYQMPDELLAIASGGEFNEFDLNAFFESTGAGETEQFKHKSDVQKWLDIIRGGYMTKEIEYLKTGTRPPFPYSDVRLLPYLQHSFWFLPNVAACHAMANLLAEKHNTFWARIHGDRCGWCVGRHRAGRAAAGAKSHRQRVHNQDHHALLRQADHGRDGPAVVGHSDAAQPQVAGDLFPVRVPGAVAVEHQEPERRQPERGGGAQAHLLRVRLRAHPRAAAALRVRNRAVAERVEPGERRSRLGVVPAGAGL